MIEVASGVISPGGHWEKGLLGSGALFLGICPKGAFPGASFDVVLVPGEDLIIFLGLFMLPVFPTSSVLCFISWLFCLAALKILY